MILLAAVLALQDRVELKEHRSYYLVQAPAGYSDAKSWPAILELHDDGSDAAKAADGWREKGFFVVAPQARGKWGSDPAFLRACLDHAKSKYRIDPLRVLLSGAGAGADYALEWGSRNGSLVGGVFVRDRAAPKEARPPVFAGDSRADALSWFARLAPARSSIEVVQDLVKDGRWLDASLVCADLMDQPDQARLARFQMNRIEGEGLMALGKVELTMTDRRYVDAWTRCRDAAVQFSWVPVGEKIRKRLSQIEGDPRVRAARNLDD